MRVSLGLRERKFTEMKNYELEMVNELVVDNEKRIVDSGEELNRMISGNG